MSTLPLDTPPVQAPPLEYRHLEALAAYYNVMDAFRHNRKAGKLRDCGAMLDPEDRASTELVKMKYLHVMAETANGNVFVKAAPHTAKAFETAHAEYVRGVRGLKDVPF